VIWRLTAHGKRPGPDLDLTFELPVCRTRDSREDPHEVELPPAPTHSPSEAPAGPGLAWLGRLATSLLLAIPALALFYLVNVHPFAKGEARGVVTELVELETGATVSGPGVSHEVTEPGVRVEEADGGVVTLAVPPRLARRLRPGDRFEKERWSVAVRVEGRRVTCVGGLATSTGWLLLWGWLIAVGSHVLPHRLRKSAQGGDPSGLGLVEETHHRFLAAADGRRAGVAIVGIAVFLVGFLGIFLVPWSWWSAFSNSVLTLFRFLVSLLALLGLAVAGSRRELELDRESGIGWVRGGVPGVWRETAFRTTGRTEVTTVEKEVVLKGVEVGGDRRGGWLRPLCGLLPAKMLERLREEAPEDRVVVGPMRQPARDLLTRVVKKLRRASAR
jgi:hypothetical protein